MKIVGFLCLAYLICFSSLVPMSAGYQSSMAERTRSHARREAAMQAQLAVVVATAVANGVPAAVVEQTGQVLAGAVAMAPPQFRDRIFQYVGTVGGAALVAAVVGIVNIYSYFDMVPQLSKSELRQARLVDERAGVPAKMVYSFPRPFMPASDYGQQYGAETAQYLNPRIPYEMNPHRLSKQYFDHYKNQQWHRALPPVPEFQGPDAPAGFYDHLALPR